MNFGDIHVVSKYVTNFPTVSCVRPVVGRHCSQKIFHPSPSAVSLEVRASILMPCITVDRS